MALFASFAVIATDAIFPTLTVEEQIRAQVLGLEFSEALLEGMLGLLLFAGALHVKPSDLRKAWLVIFLMATIGVGISPAIPCRAMDSTGIKAVGEGALSVILGKSSVR